MEKILYVSDLDGTLLRHDEKISEYTNKVVNQLVEDGMIFSYATARSYETSHKVAAGIKVGIPIILHNGIFIRDNVTGENLISNFFDKSVYDVLHDLMENDIFPLVYSVRDGEEKFSYIEEKCTPGVRRFLASRQGDRRMNPVATKEALLKGDIFYLVCIDEVEKIKVFYEKYKGKYHCIFDADIYSKDQWLEILPLKATKANAVLQLKEFLHCDKVIVFGDGLNDVDMFEVADESYAVSNAADELKKIATAVIGSNEDDGVAKWLHKHGMEDSYERDKKEEK